MKKKATSSVPAGKVRIGISGWRYVPWRRVFYPEKLTQKKELAYASSIFRSIEINGTFYSLQRPEYFEAWRGETPDGFVFSVKGPKFITHVRRLADVETPVANFLASGILCLGPKLGPILWQLPPNFRFEPEKLKTFLEILPHDTESAGALARQHDKFLKGRATVNPDAKRPLRHAIEVRHSSFAVPEFVEMLRAYNVALVCADTVEWPRVMDVTSDFMYCRLHGSEVLYSSGYTDEALDQWAVRVSAWARGREPADAERVIKGAGPKLPTRDVFVYFDNDVKLRAPFDAQSLMARIDKLISPSL
jgi:uncharacterized protein YecE (DUF72 family)